MAGFAIVGSPAFLASSMKMPLTALVLIVEFTRVGHDFLIPISLAVAGSISVFQRCVQIAARPVKTSASAGFRAVKPAMPSLEHLD